LCVFVIKSLHRLWVFSVVVRLDRLESGTTHTFHIFSCFTLQKTICCNSTYGLRKRGIQWSMKERMENLDYAEDICLLAQRFCDMEEKLKRLKEEAELVGLHININKMKRMRVDVSNVQKFRLEEMEIEKAGSFVNLGSLVSESEGTEEVVASRIKKANGVFVQLHPVWRNLNISKEVKI